MVAALPSFPRPPLWCTRQSRAGFPRSPGWGSKRNTFGLKDCKKEYEDGIIQSSADSVVAALPSYPKPSSWPHPPVSIALSALLQTLETSDFQIQNLDTILENKPAVTLKCRFGGGAPPVLPQAAFMAAPAGRAFPAPPGGEAVELMMAPDLDDGAGAPAEVGGAEGGFEMLKERAEPEPEQRRAEPEFRADDAKMDREDAAVEMEVEQAGKGTVSSSKSALFYFVCLESHSVLACR